MSPSPHSVATRQSWAAVVRSAVISTAAAEQALADMEVGRTRYTEQHRLAAERIAQLVPEMGRDDLAMRAQLILGDIEFQQNGVLRAVQTVESIRSNAESSGEAYVLARAHFLLTLVQHSIGDEASARINGVRSVELLADDAPAAVRIDHLYGLAAAYAGGEDSSRCLAEALDLAVRIGDVARIIHVHNGLAFSAFTQGDHAIATEHAGQIVELSTTRHVPLTATILDTIADIDMMHGRHETAVRRLEPYTPRLTATARRADFDHITDIDPNPYGLAEVVLSLATAHRARGRFVTAARALDRAVLLAQSRGLQGIYARALEARAQLLADVGDYRGAYEQQVAFYGAVKVLHSDEQETRARIARASFNAAEVRRDTEIFRELAMRDALTGLYNRRFTDQTLTALTTQSTSDGTPLSGAIVDVDFFKRVNDELSHEVGDQALRALADILAGLVVQPEIVGRLGGEEFVILMPGLDASAAWERCERVRRAVEDYPWKPITAEVPVTVSVGVSTAPTGRISPSALLANADRNLYAAKRSGRNRVLADPS